MVKRTILLSLVLCLVLIIVFIPSPSDAQESGVLPLNQLVNGSLDVTQTQQEWALSAEPNTTVNLSLVRTSGTAPLSLQIFNSFGAIVVNINTDTSGSASIPTLYLEGGAYRLILRGDFSATTDPITYALSLNTIAPSNTNGISTQASTINLPTPSPEPESPAFQLEIGERFEGVITEPGEVLRFAFLGYAESYITFGMNAPEDSGVDPFIQLRGPDGRILTESDNYYGTPNALVVHFELPATGVYELLASSEDGTGLGDYMVAVGRDFILYDIERGVGAHNQPIIATLENLGVRDIWWIDLEAGEEVSISVEDWGEETIDPMVELVSPGGETLAFDDDGGENKNALIQGLRAPVSGRYRVHVAAYDHGSRGTYRLIWRAETRSPTPTPIIPTRTPTLNNPAATASPDTTQTETPIPFVANNRGSEQLRVSAGDFAARRFRLTRGQQLNLYVEGYWGFDGVLELYTPTGVLLDRIDDVGTGQSYDINPRLTLFADSTGDYLVQVYSYDTLGGEFSLHWSIE